MLTLAVIVEEGDDFIDDLDIGKSSTLRLAYFLWVSPAFNDEVDDVEHRV